MLASPKSCPSARQIAQQGDGYAMRMTKEVYLLACLHLIANVRRTDRERMHIHGTEGVVGVQGAATVHDAALERQSVFAVLWIRKN